MNAPKTLLIVVFVPLIAGLVYWFTSPKDILTDQKGKAFSEADYQKGKQLISDLEEASGGKDSWSLYQTARFVQTADWYDRLKISHWDTVPQRFEMTSYLPGDDASLILLNGPNRGEFWGIEGGKTYTWGADSSKIFAENERHAQKLVFKSYWFQFPFRIWEADIVAFSGTREVDGKQYETVFASWGSEEANRDFDQFILYLDPETKLCEYLYFTVRDALQPIHLNARFSDFRSVGAMKLPFLQEVRYGIPGEEGLRFHENRYESIELLP